MPEGDSLHRAARRLQPLVGQRLQVESPHPRGRLTGVAERVDGRILESVTAVGKNLFLRFEGGVTVRSHLRMTGRWRVEPRGAKRRGLPWLVLRGEQLEGVALGHVREGSQPRYDRAVSGCLRQSDVGEPAWPG